MEYNIEHFERRVKALLGNLDKVDGELCKEVYDALNYDACPSLGEIKGEVFQWICAFYAEEGRYPDPKAIESEFKVSLGIGGSEVDEILGLNNEYHRDNAIALLRDFQQERVFRLLQEAIQDRKIADVEKYLHEYKRETGDGFEFKLLEANDVEDEPEPYCIMRQKGSYGAVIEAGEVTILSGSGSSGKSTLNCQLAIAAAYGLQETVELEVRPGNVVLLSWEDSRRRVYDRIEWIKKRLDLTEVESEHKIYSEFVGRPLYDLPDAKTITSATRPEKSKYWHQVWDRIREVNPILLIIDPVTQAYLADTNNVTSVRSFMDDLTKEAKTVGNKGCGILLVTHPTKEERNLNNRSPVKVMGSAGWTDRARSVLEYSPSHPEDGGLRAFELTKVNYAKKFAMELRVENTTLTFQSDILNDRERSIEVPAGVSFVSMLADDWREERQPRRGNGNQALVLTPERQEDILETMRQQEEGNQEFEDFTANE